jgi:hypothetical protein
MPEPPNNGTDAPSTRASHVIRDNRRGNTVTTVSNFASTGAGLSQVHHDDRAWVAVLAATGWVVLTTATLLLATGVWSAPGSSADDQTGTPGPSCQPVSGIAVPRPRGTEPSAPRTTTPPRSPQPVAPRPRVSPDQQALIMARIPRQPNRQNR